jgi:pimeloyl-ACP methyl ester carboxylesterase
LKGGICRRIFTGYLWFSIIRAREIPVQPDEPATEVDAAHIEAFARIVIRDGREKRIGLCPAPRGTTALDRLPPALAGDIAFRIFCTPELSQHRSDDHDLLTARARFHLRNAKWERVPTPAGTVQAYTFEPDGTPRGTVVLVHGWTSEASFMTAFMEPLRRSGLRVVAFDFPAHGLSDGRRTNLADCARAMLAVCDHFGPIQAVVAHSFGGFVSLLVAEGGPPMSHAHPIERFVLISCPNRLADVTANFGRTLSLGPAAQRAYEHHLARVGHRPVETFSATELLDATHAPALVIHGRGDEEVPFANAEAIVGACPGARLMAFEGMGHRNVLFAPPVFRAVMNELAPVRQEASAARGPAHGPGPDPSTWHGSQRSVRQRASARA